MDDIVWWCMDKNSARQVLAEFSSYLSEDYKLSLKPNPQINRSSRGLTYCGFRIFPGTVRLTNRKLRRYRLLRRRYESAWERSDMTNRDLQSTYDAI
jgi:RNA-directed DNA polymerase